ncbi:hypothetical protein EMCRGX_G000699 [Ephydatia muelleri]
MDPLFKERMTAIVTAKGASTKSCVLSQEKFDAIVHHLSSPQDKVDPHFKHWVKSRNFQLADLPGLELFKVLVIPNEGSNKLCDIVQAVHADELKHSGYKKVLDYVQRHYFGVTRGFAQEFCTHCPVCQLSQPQNTRPPLHPIIENDFLDRVQVDLIDMRHSPDNEYNHIVSGPKDEVDADGEVEHSTLKLSSQVSETPDKQQEEDEGDSKSTIHTAIREKVRDNTYLAVTHMAVKYNKKKGVKTQVFSSNTGWLSDMHMEAANVLLREAFPAVDGLQNPILQQNMSFSVPSFEFVQFLLVSKNHWLVISNIGEEMDTVCNYDSMQNRPDGECISLVARYVQCPDSHITIKVMNVQLQDNGYACGELAVAFATSLIHGEDPTQLHYKELRSHFKNCVDTYSITPFPSWTSVVSHQPRVVHEIRKRVYCKCRAPDNGKPMIHCCACRQGASTPNALESEHKLTSGSVPLALKHFNSCACFNDHSGLM